jgi:hypothetical protein
MKRSNWLDELRTTLKFSSSRRHRRRDRRQAAVTRRARFEPLEERRLLAVDYGDASDPAIGAGPGNYQTQSGDNGPSHTIVPGLRIGPNLDGEDGTLQNMPANADDVNLALPDDEDGVTNPAADFVLTIGAQPTVNVRVTNTTGSAATLYGWIDYNANGAFDNSIERTSVSVPNGTSNAVLTLVFPSVPDGLIGGTYARLRLSTDIAAANSFGPAVDGEVEDYRATIIRPSSSIAESSKTKTIGFVKGGLASLGDLDGDGITDLAAGDSLGGSGRVHVHFMNANGTVKSTQQIASQIGGGPVLTVGDYFGSSLASLGDLNGDGITDLLVGARGDSTSGFDTGAVYVLFLNTNGTVKASQKIATGIGGGPVLPNNAYFGWSVAALGDLDGDGITEIAVGARGKDEVYLFFLNANGTARSNRLINVGGEWAGSALGSLGDMNGDGVNDLAVGSSRDDSSGSNRGAVSILFMNPNGTVKSSQKIASGTAGGPVLPDTAAFGSAIASLGDIDGDGVSDIIVGADLVNFGTGATYVLLMNSNGTVKASQTIGSNAGGGPPVSKYGGFGGSLASLGDLDGDGFVDFAVGGSSNGYVYALFLKSFNNNPLFTSAATASVPDNSTAVMTVSAADPDLPPQPLTYAIIGGADQSKLNITTGGLLSFISPPRFGTPMDANGDNVYVVTVQVSDGKGGAATQTISVTVTGSLFDFGDAPDTAVGAGPGNYNTLVGDNGPRHTIVSGIRIGTNADGEGGVLQDSSASADDVNLALPDDEDGLVNPAANLVLTVGAQPTVSIRISNMTGSTARLYGWIDYNGDGLFDNVTERSSSVVPGSTNNEIFELVFPPVATGFVGTTFARFRLSTDPAAADAIGPAADGEVEDYRASITRPSDVTIETSKTKRLDPTPDPIPLTRSNRFGASVASLGDLDGDGVIDLAVGATHTFFRVRTGDVEILLMNSNGSVKNRQVVSLGTDDYFGNSLAALGDVNGDGVTDLAVGAYLDPTVGTPRGAVYIVFLNANGTLKGSQKIAPGIGASPALMDDDRFGSSVTSIGDLDGDGISDLVVGASGDDTLGTGRGAVYVLFMGANGTVKSSRKIASNMSGGPSLADDEAFGSAVASIGDFDGDGVSDLVVGAAGGQSFGGNRPGAAYLLFMHSNGTAKASQKISSGIGGGPTLANGDAFGSSMASVGDLDGDNVADLLVGAQRTDDAAGNDVGAAYVLLMHPFGGVKSSHKILKPSPSRGGDLFGSSVTSVGDLDGDGIRDLAIGASQYDIGGVSHGAGDDGAVYLFFLKSIPTDFGDAPDATTGVGTGNYNTRFVDDGPSHLIVNGIRMGANVDGDTGAAQSVAANADDVDTTLPDDEDGLVDPASDLNLTIGAQPRVSVRVTNTIPGFTTLYGWIDYNNNGVFENATERASMAVPLGITNGIVTLVFPTVPSGFTGSTYARFRISRDAAAANATGAASSGEVEDYRVVITAASNSTADDLKTVTIASGTGVTLANGDEFGGALGAIGDLDGDGVEDFAVGAPVEVGGATGGSVRIFFMNANRTIKSVQRITSGIGGMPGLAVGDYLGSSIALLGDVNRDGVSDLAVGAPGDDTGGSGRGAVYVLFMAPNGTVSGWQKLSSGRGPAIANGDAFGTALTPIGDLDGDGVFDLAVGAAHDDTGGTNRGALHVLFLNRDGSVKSNQKITSLSIGAPALANDDLFGSSLASVGDLDSDGISDLVVGAPGDDTGGINRGAVHLLLMNTAGSVKNSVKIGSGVGGMPALANEDFFGSAVAAMGDIDGDGRDDVAVGATGDDTGGLDRGAVHMLLLNADGSVKVRERIANNVGGGPTLSDYDHFGSAIASLGDVDGDGLKDVAVGAEWDDTGGNNRGASYLLFLKAINSTDFGDAPDTSVGTGLANYNTLVNDNGPRHTIVAGLRMGASVDVDAGVLQNAAANADDVNLALPDDEDGLVNPAADLALTIGGQPTVNVRVTNTSGSTATLYGWIDYNANGVFDNLTERSSAAVLNGTSNGSVMLVFPEVPAGFTGRTYARFRLSTDAAASNPIGAAPDGEVEDHQATIIRPSDGSDENSRIRKIASGTSGGPTLVNGDKFGSSTAALGDLDGDGVNDIAVGAPIEYGRPGSGAVHIMLMNADGTVKSREKFSFGAQGDYFGHSVASLGDIDGDGVVDVAVGADKDNTGGAGRGAVYVVFLNGNGSAKSSQKIASGIGGGPTLVNGDRFGSSIASLGDLDGDSLPELAVGAISDDTGGSYRGAVHVLFLNANGTAKGSTKIASGSSGGPMLADYDMFGVAAASLGDVDGDGVTDLAVEAFRDDTGGNGRGALFVLFLNTDGTVKQSKKLPVEPAVDQRLQIEIILDALSRLFRTSTATGSPIWQLAPIKTTPAEMAAGPSMCCG